jgi:hypothetical protein
MLRSFPWSFSLRLGHGSGGRVFDHDGGAYQSVRCPSWWSASGPPAESGLTVVAEMGNGDGSSECGALPRALERERGLRGRLEGGATKSAGPLAEGAQDRCDSGTAAAPGAELQVAGSGTVGDSDREADGFGGAQPRVAVPRAGGGASCLSAHGGGTTCVCIG